MTARAFGELTAKFASGKPAPSAKKVWVGNVRRTFQPVRRNSYHVGEREKRMWRPFGDGTKQCGRRLAGAWLSAAENYELENKPAGKVNGPLGHIGLQVLKALLKRIDFKSGRLDPSIERIMEWTRRSRAAVCAALARLKDHGFLDWIRRTEPIEDPEPFGPQVRQISNAYGFDVARLPKAVAGFIKRLIADSPAPDDVTWARSVDAADTWEMQKQEPPQVFNRAFGDNEAISSDLDRLHASMEAHWLEQERNASSPDGQNPGDYTSP